MKYRIQYADFDDATDRFAVEVEARNERHALAVAAQRVGAHPSVRALMVKSVSQIDGVDDGQ